MFLYLVQIGFIPLMMYGLVMWITRSRKYAGKITIWQTNVSDPAPLYNSRFDQLTCLRSRRMLPGPTLRSSPR